MAPLISINQRQEEKNGQRELCLLTQEAVFHNTVRNVVPAYCMEDKVCGWELYLNPCSDKKKTKTPKGDLSVIPSDLFIYLHYFDKVNGCSTNINNVNINTSISFYGQQSTVTNQCNECLVKWLTDILFIMTNHRGVTVLQLLKYCTMAIFTFIRYIRSDMVTLHCVPFINNSIILMLLHSCTYICGA